MATMDAKYSDIGRRPMTRLGAGHYRVPSDTREALEYDVLLDMEEFTGGVCNCQGYEAARRNGNACRHIRRVIAAEMELATK